MKKENDYNILRMKRINMKLNSIHDLISENYYIGLGDGIPLYINKYYDNKELLKKYGDFKVIEIYTYDEEILISIRQGNE